MASLRERLERLEAALRPPHEVPVEVRLLLKEIENRQREEDGLDPLPLTPEEEEADRASTRHFLEWIELQKGCAQGNPEALAELAPLEAYAREEEIARLSRGGEA